MNSDDRQEALELCLVRHTLFEEALARLTKLRDRRVGGDTARGECRLGFRALPFIGEAGAGKSTVLDQFMAMQGSRPTLLGPDGDVRPVVYVEVPDRTTTRAVVARIHKAIGSPVGEKENKADLIDRLAHVFPEMGTKLLILDEAHHLVLHHSQPVVKENAEFLKSMLNRCNVQMLLAGTGDVLKLRAVDGELRRRMFTPFMLRAYNWGIISERVEFCALLNHYEQALAYKKECGFAAPNFARRIYLATGGVVGIVAKFLSLGVDEADRRQERCISLASLAAVYEGENCEERPVPELDKVLPDGFNEQNNPFVCDEVSLRRLWKARFESPEVDNSEKTRLQKQQQEPPSAFGRRR